MSWKVEVIADETGKWYSNACRFRTCSEAKKSAEILADNWTLVRETRVVESDEPANYKWVSGEGQIPLAQPKRKRK